MNTPILAWTDFILDLSDVVRDMQEHVYVVGGAVRDALLRRPLKDIDLVTTDKGIKLGRKIANHFKGDFYILDDERDVARVLIDTPDGKIVIDISGLRAVDLAADLADRDFTVNALAVDLKGDLNQLIDPLGGAQDLITKRLRRCSPTSITNDPIRILRGIRQSIQFGMRLDPDTLQDMKVNAERLHEPSPERIRDELVKLLSLPKPTAALRVADNLGVLQVILPELSAQHDLQQAHPHIHDVWNHTLAVMDALNHIASTIMPNRTDDTAAQFNLGMIVVALDRYRTRLQDHLTTIWSDERPHRALLMLTALFHDIGKALTEPTRDERGRIAYPNHEIIGAEVANDRLTDLKFSNAERKFVVSLVQSHIERVMWHDTLTPLDIYRFWKRGQEGIDLILLSFADYLGTTGHTYDQALWLHLVENAQILLDAYFEHYDELVNPPALLNGDDLMATLGLPPGPVIRDLLELIREGQVAGIIYSTEDALQQAREFLKRAQTP